MKKFFYTALILLGVSSVATAKTSKTATHKSTDVQIESIAPSSASSNDYTLTINCPGCHATMKATFQRGYTSMTTAQCPKCRKKYKIEYTWERSKNYPDIKKITEYR